MFGNAEILLDNLDNSFESGDSTASQSDSIDEDIKDLFFSLEEIQLMSDEDKITYMNKLQLDWQEISDKIDEVLEKIKDARKEAKIAIEKGNETMKLYE